MTVRSRWSGIRSLRHGIFIEWRCRSSTPWSTRCTERRGNAWNLRCWVHMIWWGNRGRSVMPHKILWLNDSRNHSGLSWLWEVLWVRPKWTSSTSGRWLWLAAAGKHIELRTLGGRPRLLRRLNRRGYSERVWWSGARSGERGLQGSHTIHHYPPRALAPCP